MGLIITILILIVTYVLYLFLSNISKESEKQEQKAKAIASLPQNFVGNKVISLYERKGYTRFTIVGMFYRDIPFSAVGKFEGKAIAETTNEYDPYAIAIYNDFDIHLGYIPKRNKKLHAYIGSKGGSVHAYGFVAYNNWGEGDFYGDVCVESDETLIVHKNPKEDKQNGIKQVKTINDTFS